MMLFEVVSVLTDLDHSLQVLFQVCKSTNSFMFHVAHFVVQKKLNSTTKYKQEKTSPRRRFRR
jgi:hypothetical protein